MKIQVASPVYLNIEVGDCLHVVEPDGTEYYCKVTEFELFGHTMHVRAEGFDVIGKDGDIEYERGTGLIQVEGSKVRILKSLR